MKKFSIVLNIILLIVVLFFIVFANIQTKLAKESQATANRLALDAIQLQQRAEDEVLKLERPK